VIFIDSNIPMYLVGDSAEHQHAARRLLERAILGGEKLVTNAEVLQEILHRYVAIKRRQAIQPAFDALLGVVDDVFAIARQDVERAKEIVAGRPSLSARDAIHVATMEHHGVTQILTFDAGFDSHPAVTRVRL